LLAAHTGGQLLVCDLAAREVVQRVPADPAANDPDVYREWVAVAATPDGSVVWTGGTPGRLHRFARGGDGRYVEVLPPADLGCAIRALKLLPDGSLLVGGANGYLRRRLPDGGTLAFLGHTDDVLDVDTVLLDGQRLVASSGFAGTVRLWRDDGTAVREIVSDARRIFTVRFSPDGTRLLTSSDAGGARIWPVRADDLLALARRRLRSLSAAQAERLRWYLDR
jgi:WD40 repeat protein